MKITKSQLRQIIKEELSRVLNESSESSYHQSMGGYIGSGGAGSSEAPAKDISNDLVAAIAKINRAINDLGADWILDDMGVDNKLTDFKLEAKSPEEFENKAKEYLNSISDDIGYDAFGDQVMGQLK